MTPARKGYTIVAVATSLALAVFVVAAVAGSRAIWLAAYAFVLLALGIAFLVRRPTGGEREDGL